MADIRETAEQIKTVGDVFVKSGENNGVVYFVFNEGTLCAALGGNFPKAMNAVIYGLGKLIAENSWAVKDMPGFLEEFTKGVREQTAARLPAGKAMN